MIQNASWRAVFFINVPLAALTLILTIWRVPESWDEDMAGKLVTLLLYGALGGALYFVPFNLQQVQGYSAIAAGASFLPFTVIVFALSRWSGGLMGRHGARLPLVVGSALTAVGFGLFAVPGIGGGYWTTYFPAIVVLGLGMALVITPLTTAVMGAVATQHAGIASGINNAIARTAGLLAIAVLGLVVAATFNTTLDRHLTTLHVDPTVQQAIDRQRPRLAGIQFRSRPTPTPQRAPPPYMPSMRLVSPGFAWPCSSPPDWQWAAPWSRRRWSRVQRQARPRPDHRNGAPGRSPSS